MTSDRLRRGIDEGRTGDKVAFQDPAAAPLGTDDEAAGTPPCDRRIAIAARQRTSRKTGPGEADERGRLRPTTETAINRTLLLTAAGILLTAAVLLLLWR